MSRYRALPNRPPAPRCHGARPWRAPRGGPGGSEVPPRGPGTAMGRRGRGGNAGGQGPQWENSEGATQADTGGAKPRSTGRQRRHTHRPPGPAGPAAAVTMGSRRAHVTTAPGSQRGGGCAAPWRRGGTRRRRGRGCGSRRDTRGYRRNGHLVRGGFPRGAPRVKTAG